MSVIKITFMVGFTPWNFILCNAYYSISAKDISLGAAL